MSKPQIQLEVLRTLVERVREDRPYATRHTSYLALQAWLIARSEKIAGVLEAAIEGCEYPHRDPMLWDAVQGFGDD